MNEALNKKVEELELSIRAINALKVNNITTVGDLVKWSRKDLLRLPNVGKLTVNELNHTLGDLDLNLKGMEKVKSEEKKKPEKDPILKSLNYEIIAKAKEAADISLAKINNQEKYNYDEVNNLFSEHENIIKIYRDSILALWRR